MLTGGGCFCGAIRHAVTGAPFNAASGHRAICRPFVAWFSVRPAEFRIVQGESQQFRSSAHGERGFCARCGIHLTLRGEGLDEIDVTAASLEAPEHVPPTDNTRTSSRLAWPMPDGRPDHVEARGA